MHPVIFNVRICNLAPPASCRFSTKIALETAAPVKQIGVKSGYVIMYGCLHEGSCMNLEYIRCTDTTLQRATDLAVKHTTQSSTPLSIEEG